MRRLARALRLYFGSRLTWRTCWRHAKHAPRFRVVARDGFRYVEPEPSAHNVTQLREFEEAAAIRHRMLASLPQDVQ